MRSIICAALVSIPLSAQAPPAFEVASIRPSPEQLERTDIGIHISGSQVRIAQLTLKDYVAMAYDLPQGQIAAPDWLGQARFDIAAKIPDGVATDRVPQMLQKLLADRFDLKAHRESKEFNVYALVVRKEGLRLQESPAVPGGPDAPAVQPSPGTVNVSGSGSAGGVAIDLGGGSSFTLANNKLEIRKATMESVANTLSRLMDRRVLDATGLTARYDLAMPLTPEEYQAVLIRSAVNAGVVLPPQALRALDVGPSDPFSGALQKFGLTLESRKSPLDVIIVDSMRRTPTDN